MSQHDYNIANGGGAAVRADINNALLAILSQNAGATAPTTTKPFMMWYDSANTLLKMRNPADDGWLTITDTGGAILASIADAAVTTAKVADANITAAKLSGAQSGSAPIYGARAWVNFNGTGTVAIRASGNVSSISDNGAGDYTVNFTTAMQDANYCVQISSKTINTNTSVSNNADYATNSASQARVAHLENGVLNDSSSMYVSIFR